VIKKIDDVFALNRNSIYILYIRCINWWVTQKTEAM